MGCCSNKQQQSPIRTIHIPYALPSSNKIQTTKYTFLTFLPKAILFQFLRAANYVYLLSAILNFLPIIASYSPAVNLAPFLVILIVSVIRQGYQDYKRYKNDRIINETTTRVLENEVYVERLWQQVRVGDYVKVVNKQSIPADLVLLYSTEQNGIAYVETANLDGYIVRQYRQRNLKSKYCIQNAPRIYPEQYSSLSAIINLESPNKNLHDFNGNICFRSSSNSEETKTMNRDNILLRGTVLKNTHYVIGLVVYTGQQTKIMLNQGNFKNKTSVVQKKVNVIQLILGLVLVAMCTLNGIMNYLTIPIDSIFYLSSASKMSNGLQAAASAMSCFLLLNFIVPISMNISIQVLKTFQADFYGLDDKMICMINGEKQSCKVLNSLIIEELGNVSYILTDKTGTLTSNTMKFRQVWVNQKQYSSQYLLETKYDELKSKDLVLLWTYICLCHDVIIDTQQNQFQGSSADQVCFLEFGAEMNYKFVKRTKTHLEIEIEGKKIIYELLMMLPFTQRKMMSVVVRDIETKQIILISKGADAVMFKRKGEIREEEEDSLNQFLTKVSKHGLRTLVLGYRKLSQQQFDRFKEEMKLYEEQKRNKLIQSNKQVQVQTKVFSIIQNNLTILGATAIQDKLQEGVPESIYNFRQAGIKVIMITGDKLQTAENIGYLSNFIDSTAEIFRLRENIISLQIQIVQIFKKIETTSIQNFSLIIQGEIISRIISLNDKVLNYYVKTIFHQCKSVIFCRSTPAQKALIVQFFKQTFSSIVLAIGDGGNDVNMIKQADIGVGLIGKQGNEAAYASDFYFGQFKHLERLLFHHGRWSYNRISYFFVYFGFKNNLITIILFMYLFYSGYSGKYGLSQLYQGCFNSFLGIIPTMYLGIFEQDVNGDQSSKVKQKLPQLYKFCRSTDLFSYKRYFIWVLYSIICSAWLFYPTMYVLNPISSTNAQGQPADWISFSLNLQVTSCLIVSFVLAIDLQIYNWWTVFCVGGGSFFASFVVFIIQNYSYIEGFGDCFWGFTDNFNAKFWALILVLTSAVVIPKIVWKAMEYELFPDQVQKMRKIQKEQKEEESESMIELKSIEPTQ